MSTPHVNTPIYLDNHATTRCADEVIDAMLPYLRTHFGNAASRGHSFGYRARAATEKARAQIAEWIGATPREIVFTSGATESNNIALLGTARRLAERGRHIITVATEHKAVLDPLSALAREGFEVTVLPVDGEGLIDVDDVRRALRDDTVLVSVMAINNEIGVAQPIGDIGALCRDREIVFHSDAAQTTYSPLNVRDEAIDLLSLSAHKLYGPKGVGALYVRSGRPRVNPWPLQHGGGHERGLRSGTLPVPLVVGFGAAVTLLANEQEAAVPRIKALRDRMLVDLQKGCDGIRVNGSMRHRAPHNLSLTIDRVTAEDVLLGMRDVACSTGSACTSETLEPSHVLQALGHPEDARQATVRLGLGRYTTTEEVDYAIARLIETVHNLRGSHDKSAV